MSSQHEVSDTDSDATVDPNESPDGTFSDEFDHGDQDKKSSTRADADQVKPSLKLEYSVHEISETDSDATVDLSFDESEVTCNTKISDFKGTFSHAGSESVNRSDKLSEKNALHKKAHADISDKRKSTQNVTSASDTDDELKVTCTGKNVMVKNRRTLSYKHDKDASTSKKPLLSSKQLSEKKLGESRTNNGENSRDTCSTLKDEHPECVYGSRCYRKNPSHFEEYRHPTDMDATLKRKLSSKKGSSPQLKRKKTVKDDPLPSTSRQTPSAVPRKSNSSINGFKTVHQAEPLGFLLTKVTGIKEQYNAELAIDIKDILSQSMGHLQKSVQFNYKIDIPWLVSQYPVEFRTKPLLVVHGAQRGEKASLDMEASVFDHIRLAQARLEMMYGTHHTKMMLLLYDSGMRVVIHTANLIEQDWFQKTQGVWVSPLFPKLSHESIREGESVTHFKQDLLEYLGAYKMRALDDWMKHVREHDLSQATVFLIGSVPGRHTADRRLAFGHMKLRKVLKKNGPRSSLISGWPVVGQFSSIGSLGNSAENWLRGEWLDSLSASQESAAAPTSKPKLQLIFPSKENVRLSLEGYAAGGSLPYSINTAKKQPYLHHFLHQWHSDLRGRSVASPHIKTYMRPSPDYSNIAWFLVTSANLSKAAWGALEKNGSQLMIRSYELGVLFLPQHFPGKKDTFKVMKAEATPSSSSMPLVFPVPYDLPPTPYTKGDRPWIWDIPYVDKPDTHGTKWCPPLS